MHKYFSLLSVLILLLTGCASISNDGSRLASVDHYVRVKSTAPSIAGQVAQGCGYQYFNGHSDPPITL